LTNLISFSAVTKKSEKRKKQNRRKTKRVAGKNKQNPEKVGRPIKFWNYQKIKDQVILKGAVPEFTGCIVMIKTLK
jgi:hypothetical protein